MTRPERIRRALATGEQAGMIEGHYCQGGMPGRRWTVWGRAVGAFEYRTHGLASERSYSTREIEATLSAVGLLVTR